MRKEIQALYINEVFRQAEYAMLAIEEIAKCIKVLSDENLMMKSQGAPIEVRIIFQHLHSLLTHSSNISKLFWPTIPNQGKKETIQDYNLRCPGPSRGDYLRSLYNIKSGNALENRNLRNDLEHFDERLDSFVADWSRYSGPSASSADGNTGDVNFIKSHVRPEFIIRHFDYLTNKFIFRGKEYELIPLKKAIESVYTRSTLIDPDLDNRRIFNHAKSEFSQDE